MSSSSESLLSDDEDEDELDELDELAAAAARFALAEASAATLATGDFLEDFPEDLLEVDLPLFRASRSTEKSFMAALVRKEEAIDDCLAAAAAACSFSFSLFFVDVVVSASELSENMDDVEIVGGRDFFLFLADDV